MLFVAWTGAGGRGGAGGGWFDEGAVGAAEEARVRAVAVAGEGFSGWCGGVLGGVS